MEHLKQAIIYAILIALVWVGIAIVPQFRKVVVPAGFDELPGLEELKDYPLDTTIGINRLVVGDTVSYRLGDEGDDVVRLGWVAGLPGDRVGVDADGWWTINGKRFERAANTPLPPCHAVPVPADHFMVLTRTHLTDSLKNGPLPATALRGRVGGL